MQSGRPRDGLHSPPVLAAVVTCHLLVGVVLIPALYRPPVPLPVPISVALISEPPPVAEEEPDVLPQPLPQTAEARRKPLRPKVAEAAPPVASEVPKPVVEPPVPAPVAARAEEPKALAAPERPQPPPPRPEPAAPSVPVARLEPEPMRARPTAEPTHPPPVPAPPVAPAAAPPVQPPPGAAPPPAPAPAEAATEPLYGADYLDNPKPVYPLMSRRLGEQGLVLLRVFVTADGDPRQVVLKEGSGYARLDRAAQDVVLRWKFVPARRGNRPVDAWVLVPIKFSLKG